MRKLHFILALMVLVTQPILLHAEEIIIPLFEVVSMTPLPGENPLDSPEQSGDNPTRPGDFRATINARVLSVSKLNESIPSAQAVVVSASTGSVVVNEVFTESMEEQIPNTGAYVLNIVTATGSLTGNFIVQ